MSKTFIEEAKEKCLRARVERKQHEKRFPSLEGQVGGEYHVEFGSPARHY